MSQSYLEDCVDQTALAKMPDYIDQSDDGGEAFMIDISEIPKALSRDDKSVKMMMRSHGLSVNREERKHFWRGLYMKREGGEEAVNRNKDLYWDTVKTCFGTTDLPKRRPSLPRLVDPSHTHTFLLTQSGDISVARIVTCFAYNSPDIQHCPILYSLAAVLRHYLTEPDCYGFISSLAASKSPRFLTQTSMQSEIEWRTVWQLQKQYNKKIVQNLVNQFGEEEMTRLAQNWTWWIFDHLPLPHVVRIVDCFLVEGQKVLYRSALSVLRQFYKFHSKQEWKSIIKQKGLQIGFKQFCQEIPATPYALLDRCFRYRGLGRVGIAKISQQIESELKAEGFRPGGGNDPDHHGRSLNGAEDVQDSSRLLTHQQTGGDSDAIFPIQNLGSKILSHQGLIRIWRWLPTRVASATPTLVYSSDEHGISLTTFFSRCDNYEQTIMIIKTTEGDIFGAYCSASWAERNFKDDKGLRQRYFGTGETFLFKIGKDPDGEDAERYQWVNLKTDPTSIKGLTKAELHARELFMSAQPDMISIGGGEGNGIYIDSTLTFGKSEKCRTFENPPLCANQDFKIAAIEVIGLNKFEL